jgi:hypothetical protein
MSAEILQYIFVAIGMGMFGDTFDDYQQEGMILHPWRRFISRFGYWAKPLGKCPICVNFWLSVGAVVCMCHSLNVIPYTLSVIGISNFTLKKIMSNGQ